MDLITPCNYKDHINNIKEVDWILEAVVERLDIKLSIYETLLPHLKDTAILTSNTSGIPLKELSNSLPIKLQKRFMITHFFNPPRYMQLLELVRGNNTSDQTYQTMVHFGENILGKGIVHAKDTPNFIGNRIGVYGIMLAINLAIKYELTIEEVDRLTGPISGRPKSATFRTADVVGLDTLKSVSLTTYEKAVKDEERILFQIPEVLQKLINKNRLGQKTRKGFYKKNANGEIVSIDFSTNSYSPLKEVRFDCLRIAKNYQSTDEKINALSSGNDKGSKYFWEIMARTLIYSANRIPEISDDIINIDNAMKWGFGWEFGPFESWDILGVRNSCKRMTEEGKKIPKWVSEMLSQGNETFYAKKNGSLFYWCPVEKELKTQQKNDKVINLNLYKTRNKTIKKDLSASLNDLGDGILNVEFHSILQPTLHPIDKSYIDIINDGLDLIEKGDFKGLVIGHQGENFCAGANLNLLLELSANQDWDTLSYAVKTMQDLTQRIRFSKGPVVAAPFQLTLGGGVELIQPAAHIIAAAETYMGLVEIGVGLIPGGSGNLRMILNALNQKNQMGAFQKIQKIFETISFAKVSTSADEAKRLGYLNNTDSIILNKDHLLRSARTKALEMLNDYQAPDYREDLKLPGKGGRTALNIALKGFKLQGKISDHDCKIGEKLAYVLTGGEKAGLTAPVDEQYILDLEREAFISLAGEQLTQDRIKYMLKKGKPLRN
jgi:3-hydroxyacyl-CoA dehydrogenase